MSDVSGGEYPPPWTYPPQGGAGASPTLRGHPPTCEIMFIYLVLTFKQSDDKSLNLKPRSTVGTHELQVYNNFFQKNV